MTGSCSAALVDVLARGQELGFLGPGPIEAHVAHAHGFAAGPTDAPGRFLDLGSGGGVPGLVLACTVWRDAQGVLLDAGERRCAFLTTTLDRLGLGDRITVVHARAEAAGHRDSLRASFDVVVARSFGRPAVTAECGGPFLRIGGWLVVSEPPATMHDDVAEQARWPEKGLALLGLARGPAWREPFNYQSLLQRETCPDRFPRRIGVPAKRPLF